METIARQQVRTCYKRTQMTVTARQGSVHYHKSEHDRIHTTHTRDINV